MGDFFNSIMQPLEYAVSWVLITLHSALVGLGLPADSGLSWGPAIVILVIIVRIMLIPLFVKQIRAQRGLQLLQPRMAELRKKYGSDRQRMAEELQKLYKETGTNPFSSCLPILAQSPFFFGLYRTLDGIARDHERGVLTPSLIESAQRAHIFGAPLPDSFNSAELTSTKIVIVVMILAMCASQFITQRQIMLKNMPGGGDNPMAQQQKILLYVFPVVFAISGVFFPVGVLLYWLTTNLWTMGQQFYVIRRMPAPGSKAEEALLARKAAKAKAAGQPATATAATGVAIVEPPPAPRQQPKRQTRTQRKTTPPPPKKVAASGKQSSDQPPPAKKAPAAPATKKPPSAATPPSGKKPTGSSAPAPKKQPSGKPPATGTPTTGVAPPASASDPPSPNGKPKTPPEGTASSAGTDRPTSEDGST